MSNFRAIDREVEVVDGLDLRAMSGGYRASGSARYHPGMLLGLLVYGYATGVFSSRKLGFAGGYLNSSLHNPSLARRLEIDDLDAQLAPLDRYGLNGLGSVIANRIRTLAGGWRDAHYCAVSCRERGPRDCEMV
jgi:hypothetical protein